MRRSIEGRFEARAMQALWDRMHSRTSSRRAHGFFGGLMRGVLQLRTPEVAGDGNRHHGVNGNGNPENSHTAVRSHDVQIEMSHGAVGKASRRLVEGLFAPLLLSGPSMPLADAA